MMIRKIRRCFGGSSIRRRSLLVVRSDCDPVVSLLLTYLYGVLRQATGSNGSMDRR